MARVGLAARFRALLLRNGANARARRGVLQRFAQKLGFVYFGLVDQYTDEHRVVRGFSASTTHRDDHYAVGSYEDYNLTLVDRTDLLELENGRTESHQWLIMEFELHHAQLPHFFLIPHHHGSTHYHKVFSSLRGLERIPLEAHSPEFNQRYGVYSIPEHAIEVEDLLSPAITQAIAAHFWPLAVEVLEGALYLYYSEHKLSQQALETILKNGIWLAQTLDR